MIFKYACYIHVSFTSKTSFNFQLSHFRQKPTCEARSVSLIKNFGKATVGKQEILVPSLRGLASLSVVGQFIPAVRQFIPAVGQFIPAVRPSALLSLLVLLSVCFMFVNLSSPSLSESELKS